MVKKLSNLIEGNLGPASGKTAMYSTINEMGAQTQEFVSEFRKEILFNIVLWNLKNDGDKENVYINQFTLFIETFENECHSTDMVFRKQWEEKKARMQIAWERIGFGKMQLDHDKHQLQLDEARDARMCRRVKEDKFHDLLEVKRGIDRDFKWW